MGQQIEFAKSRLFDKDSLAVTNVKFFPGSSRETTAEDLAAQLNRAISQIEANDFELVDLEELNT